MFIDLQNGACINIDQIYGVTTSTDGAEFVICILLKSMNRLNESNEPVIYIKFKHSEKANKFLDQYFGMKKVFKN